MSRRRSASGPTASPLRSWRLSAITRIFEFRHSDLCLRSCPLLCWTKVQYTCFPIFGRVALGAKRYPHNGQLELWNGRTVKEWNNEPAPLFHRSTPPLFLRSNIKAISDF